MEVDISLQSYLKAVRTESLPGGGSVAAFTGALAAALLGKVCQLTVGREEFKEFDEQTMAVQQECAELTAAFSELMGRDEAAYQSVVDAYKMSKDTEEQLATRRIALDAAWVEAVEVPALIAEKCYRVFELSRPLVGRSNKTTTADIALAANLAYSVIEASVIIIKSNLAKSTDPEYARQKTEWADQLAADAAVQWEAIKFSIDDFCRCTL